MTAESVRTTILRLIREQLSHDAPIGDGDLAESLDSIERMSLVVAIEDHFEICFDADDEEQVRTLDDVIGLVLGKLGVPAHG